MNLESLLILFYSSMFYLLIYIMLALSTNIEYGYTGVPNLGKVLFFFIGSIVTAALTTKIYDSILGVADPLSAVAASLRVAYAADNPAVSIGIFILSLVLSAGVAGVIGYLASYPALALKESMLAITLLIFGEAARVFVRTYEPLVGGVFGISGIANPFVFLKQPTLVTTAYLATTFLVTALVFVLVERVSNSPFGRVMKAVRDDELVGYVFGKNVAQVRGQVLFIGSAIAGAAGSIYTFYSQSIFPDDFVPSITFFILTMIILGGVANNVGAVVGAVVLSLFERFSQASTLAVFGIVVGFDISYLRYAFMGALIIVMLLFKPMGLVAEKQVKTALYEVLKKRKPA
ncbi:MAG: branched-chain amino acid ABC transporter permease [Candidatus Caldarchaeum sp.]